MKMSYLPVDFDAVTYHLSQVCALCTGTVFPKFDARAPSRLSNGSRCSEKKAGMSYHTSFLTVSDWPTDLRVNSNDTELCHRRDSLDASSATFLVLLSYPLEVLKHPPATKLLSSILYSFSSP